MTLFDDTELFTVGTAPKKHIDLPDLELMHYEGFIAKEEADLYYTTLLQNTPWREYQMPMYNKIVKAPRMIAWYGEQEEAGENALPWTPELSELRSQVEKETGLHFNAVVLNLYRNGSVEDNEETITGIDSITELMRYSTNSFDVIKGL